MLRKKTLSDFLSFSRRDRIAIFSMVMIIIALYLTPHFIDQGQEDILRPDNFLLAAIDTLQHKQQVAGSEQQDDFFPFSPPKEQWPARIFEFDPNTLTVKGWQKLGLNEKTSQTIERYRQKGGRFYKPADLQKIWGLPKGFYERVKDHISISAPEETSGKNIYEKPISRKQEELFTKYTSMKRTPVLLLRCPELAVNWLRASSVSGKSLVDFMLLNRSGKPMDLQIPLTKK